MYYRTLYELDNQSDSESDIEKRIPKEVCCTHRLSLIFEICAQCFHTKFSHNIFTEKKKNEEKIHTLGITLSFVIFAEYINQNKDDE